MRLDKSTSKDRGCLTQSPYLNCAHCGCEFLGTQGQLARVRDGQQRSYCSETCQRAGSALRLAGPSLIPIRVCQQCGAEYQPGPMAFGRLFCSVACRSAFYLANRPKFWMQCALCLKDFQGSIGQKHRADRGGQVFCSVKCRQLNNGRVGAVTKSRNRTAKREAFWA